MPNFENAFKIVCELVEDFKENEARYLSPQYQEAEVRRDYIDKLLEALGWDVYHRTQKNPYAQEVKVEKSVNVGKAQKRADYALYISPEFRQPKFFVEAKKPSRNLKNADDYFQTIRYGWNANTPVAVLTDFQEFHVLDCRYKPNIKSVLDNPNHKTYFYTDYADREKFGEIFYLFNRDDVAKSSLENYSAKFEKIKGKAKLKLKESLQSIDDDFLEYIDEVRETLAKAFKKNDANLSSEELTEATQRTIDRIVFIRFLEDKLIEPEYYVSEFGKKGNAWSEFITVCRKLDAKYNGIVFKKHFIDEQTFQGPEQSTFRKICEDISYLNSPYDFNAIPIHILGSIYERFLGKVVNATAQRVKVEEKPEVRKAGGVYYTPKYIVDYIVDNTVGKIIRNENAPSLSSQNVSSTLSSPRDSSSLSSSSAPIGDPKDGNALERHSKTPAEISRLRFADIACGSGSFLIGVFETLLKYHTEYYQSHPEEAKKDGCINKDGQWILSIKQKQYILLNNIYGVDIDNQAVEVTQLSLALKMLEDETTATANEMQVLFHEKILPDLSKNIVCGNSLIGTDILEGKMFASEEERKLNPMDFESRFPHIFSKSNTSTLSCPNVSSHLSFPNIPIGNPDTKGFDAIVGNPPYIRIQSLREFNSLSLDYISKQYTCAGKGNYDIYLPFIEKSLKLISKSGFVGFILPHKFFNADYGEAIRKMILEGNNLSSIVYFGDNQIFDNATTYTCLLFLDKTVKDSFRFIDVKNIVDWKTNHTQEEGLINLTSLNSESWNFNISKNSDVLNKIKINKIELGEIAKIFVGLQTSADPVYILKYERELEKTYLVYSKALKRSVEIEKGVLKPLLKGTEIRRYDSPSYQYLILFPYTITGDTIGIIDESTLKTNYPNAWAYFLDVRKILESRDNGKWKVSQWWQFGRSQNIYEMEKSKILTQVLSKQASFTLDPNAKFSFVGGGNAGGYGLLIKEDYKILPQYLIGLLNSKLLDTFLKSISTTFKGGYFSYAKRFIENIPIKDIDFQNESEKQSHDKIVSLVDQMLESKKQLHSSKTDKDKTYWERKCEQVDHAIDSEVYKLYGLTEEEIKIVEGKE